MSVEFVVAAEVTLMLKGHIVDERIRPVDPLMEKLAELRNVSPSEIDLVARVYRKMLSDKHPCPGELVIDSYTDGDGYEHLVISTWYECDSYLETRNDLTILE